MVFSDAGLRRAADGAAEIGLGWLMLQRSTGQVVAAASWAVREEVWAGAEDVNRWELRAALAAIGAVVFLKAGQVGQVWRAAAVPGAVLTAKERHKLAQLVSRPA